VNDQYNRSGDLAVINGVADNRIQYLQARWLNGSGSRPFPSLRRKGDSAQKQETRYARDTTAGRIFMLVTDSSNLHNWRVIAQGTEVRGYRMWHTYGKLWKCARRQPHYEFSWLVHFSLA